VSASSFTDWAISCDHPGCDDQRWASDVVSVTRPTAAAVRKALRPRGWVTGVRADDGSRKRKDYCPHHNPDLAIRVRAALEAGGWAEFSSRADAGKVILNAPGPKGSLESWRSLVTTQCASYLARVGFDTQIAGDDLYVGDGAGSQTGNTDAATAAEGEQHHDPA